MDDDSLQELEQQLCDGHVYPCAIDMWNLTRWNGKRHKYPLRWLYGKRYLRRSFTLGKHDGTTLIAVMLN
jgi:hypothetical protein